MATLARKVGGSLDSVMAMTGHKDLKLADHYSKIQGEVQKETSTKVLEHIRELGLIDKPREDFLNVIHFEKAKKRIG